MINADADGVVDMPDALSPHLEGVERSLDPFNAIVEAKLEDIILSVLGDTEKFSETARANVVSHLLRTLSKRSVEDTAFARRGLWLRVVSAILDRGPVGKMLATCLPIVTQDLFAVIENLPLQLLAPGTQVRLPWARIARTFVSYACRQTFFTFIRIPSRQLFTKPTG